MTKQNRIISLVYWAIYFVAAFGIWVQHDESSNETVRYLTYLWLGIYALAAVIIFIKNRKK